MQLKFQYSFQQKGQESKLLVKGTSYLDKFQKEELSQVSRTTRRKMMKICENLKEGNNNHHERFHTKRANISARYND